MKKLQILVPHYRETETTIKPLLDSIAIQQNVNFEDIGVIICNDGPDVILSHEFLEGYPFDIQYDICEHNGVSATRNECLDRATADYVMFCDADDMFYNACGLWVVFREISLGGFDTLVSAFIEESRVPQAGDVVYINHDMDSTFVHGKIHRRQYLVREGIRWDDTLTVHEDSYFNCLCRQLTRDVKYCPTPFYLWKWRDDSVCRHDPKYILRTYNDMLDSSTALVKELERRGKVQEAQFYATSMVYDAYFTMNKDEWLNQENQGFRQATERRFIEYYRSFNRLTESIDRAVKAQIIVNQKNRFFQEGLLMEHITFDQWLDHITTVYKE